MTIEHKDLTGANLHEPKGAAAASVNTVYIADGAGSGSWAKADASSIIATGKNEGQLLTADGSGGSTWDADVWGDIVGDVTPKASGASTPTLSTFRGGNTKAFAYSAGDDADCFFHLPHDYKPGSDIYLHIHWSHNGTAISGSFVTTCYVTYQKGHNQGIFPAEIAPTITTSTPNIATIPRWQHMISEVQLSAASPSATQLDSDNLEPDGVIILHLVATTIPTITGGSPNEPFIYFVDIHYQKQYFGTKNKTPNFYT